MEKLRRKRDCLERQRGRRREAVNHSSLISNGLSRKASSRCWEMHPAVCSPVCCQKIALANWQMKLVCSSAESQSSAKWELHDCEWDCSPRLMVIEPPWSCASLSGSWIFQNGRPVISRRMMNFESERSQMGLGSFLRALNYISSYFIYLYRNCLLFNIEKLKSYFWNTLL